MIDFLVFFSAALYNFRVPLATRTCLIVEDEGSVRAYVKTLVERRQFKCVEAENGIQGLRLAETLGDALDLIVSDIHMPDGDGLTFVCSVRELFPTMPIVLMSGDAEPERQKSLSTSFQFVPKPFSPGVFLHAIESALKQMELRKR